jgi:hypothetical protein
MTPTATAEKNSALAESGTISAILMTADEANAQSVARVIDSAEALTVKHC